MIFKSLLFVLFVLCAYKSCDLQPSRTEAETNLPDTKVVLRPTEAILRSEETRIASAKEIQIVSKIDTSDTFHWAQFVNKQQGWASTYKSLFATSDGGTTWTRLPFQTPEDSEISSLFFVNESQGWLSLIRRVYTERYGLGNSSQILSTRDGGRTWKEQGNFPNEIIINEISFSGTNRGLAVGARMIDQPIQQGPPYQEILVLSTTNGGNDWTNISELIKSAIRNESGAFSDAGWNVLWSSETEIHLLTRNGRVVQSVDQGNTWKIIARFHDERPKGVSSSVGYYKLVSDDERRLRVIAGAIGDEGYWGDLVVKSDDNSWTSFELRLIPILDAVFLSKNEVLASGTKMPSPDDKSTARTGIVLQSQDCGKSWTPIYRSKSKEAFISLSKIGDSEFYAVSDKGTFLKFVLK